MPSRRQHVLIALGAAVTFVASVGSPDSGRASALEPALDRFVGVYRFVGDRGVSKSSFALAEDGRLTMQTTIDAARLPSTIRFSTTYARDSRSSGAR